MAVMPGPTILAAFVGVLFLGAPIGSDAQEHKAEGARIGFLATGSLSVPKSAYVFRVFRDSIRDLGYVEGQNLSIEYRGAAGRPDQLPRLAAELVALKPNVMVVTGPASIRAARDATTTIPVVA